MVKCAKKLLNPLTKWINMQKRVASSRRQSFGSYICAYYVNFQFSHACIRSFCSTNYKKLQNVFNVVTKQRQNWNTEHIMQFFKIAAYVHIAKLYGLVHYAVCAFCHIYMACGLRLWASIAYQAVYTFLVCMGIWSVKAWACRRVWRFCVFVIVDVNLFVCHIYIIVIVWAFERSCVYMIVRSCLGGDWWSSAAIGLNRN